MSAVLVTYRGSGQPNLDPDRDIQTVPGISGPFRPGVPRLIDDHVAAGAGADNPDGRTFAEFFVGLFNQNRGKGHELFDLADVPDGADLGQLAVTGVEGASAGIMVDPDEEADLQRAAAASTTNSRPNAGQEA